MNQFMMLAAAVFLSVLMVACAVAGASGEYPSTKIRYKMTVEVDTPEGVKTGSAVREISMASRPMMLGESNDTHVKLEKGEAVVVALGQRGTLFATLGISMDNAIEVILNAFPSGCLEGNYSRCGIRHYSSIKEGSQAELPVKHYPPFFMFKNLQDPMSVAGVRDRHSCSDHLNDCTTYSLSMEGAFGEGVKLKSVTIEITSRNPTEEVDKWLPWLKGLNGKYLHGGNTSRGAPMSLNGGDFVMGD